MSYIEESIKTVEESINNMINFLNEKETEKLYIQPSKEEWSVMQVAAHVVEAIPFWVNDVNNLLVVPHGRWGRNHEHAGRLAAVEPSVVEQLKVDDVVQKLSDLIPLVTNMFKRLKEDDLNIVAPTYNPNFDDKPLKFILDILIVKHVVGHYDQMVRHYNKIAN